MFWVFLDQYYILRALPVNGHHALFLQPRAAGAYHVLVNTCVPSVSGGLSGRPKRPHFPTAAMTTWNQYNIPLALLQSDLSCGRGPFMGVRPLPSYKDGCIPHCTLWTELAAVDFENFILQRPEGLTAASRVMLTPTMREVADLEALLRLQRCNYSLIGGRHGVLNHLIDEGAIQLQESLELLTQVPAYRALCDTSGNHRHDNILQLFHHCYAE